MQTRIGRAYRLHASLDARKAPTLSDNGLPSTDEIHKASPAFHRHLHRHRQVDVIEDFLA